MIYELRIYHCIPGRLPALLKRFDTITLKIWERHGIKQAGFWTVGIGESNQDLYYMLAWESAGRPREEMGRVPGRPGMDREAGGNRKRRSHRRLGQQPDAAADEVLLGEIILCRRGGLRDRKR